MSTTELSRKIDEAEAEAEGFSCGNLFFHQSMAVLSALLVLCALLCVVVLHFRLPASQISDFTGYLPFLAAMGYCWWQRRFRLFQACALACWSCLFSMLLQFPMFMASQFHAPLEDATFAHLDDLIRMEVPAVMSVAAVHPWARILFDKSYALLFPFVVLAAVLPALRFRFTAAKELIVGTAFGTLAGTMLFGFFPAVGPWLPYHFRPNAQQYDCQTYFLSLRAGALHVIDLSRSGFICFPSFHVFLAILAGVALSSIKPLRFPSILLACLIIISTMTTGWHYAVDVLGGMLLAALSILAAKAFTRIETRRMQARA
ncbi:MAG: phosphatase PAP2 family protein [Terracidiphilus sp.]